MRATKSLRDVLYFFDGILDGNYDPQRFLNLFPNGLSFTTQQEETYVIDRNGILTRQTGNTPFPLHGAKILSLGAIPAVYANDITETLSLTNSSKQEMIDAQTKIRRILAYVGKKPRIDPNSRLIAIPAIEHLLKYRTPAHLFEPLVRLISQPQTSH